ncbi:Organic hydroperoxide resistance transcriptional regulator [Cystobacter fuscus DSM 2262]|uniref:Organic hydroperoxide resistance transcriptional regulator n=1 Tax=Cystobacter fuscus (strain ATCC 25194 / DSM 2262 / NBRC 100088 / M29) TaxID=1242864 RepID=S9NZG7_CYSF2|nr:MarR family transcriptional regulator [Cystobacter fuscus]EPX55422.1 Organic hydroperoxide resistance transcriptional regulator [Cystobacter fuscus DSM 2262]
MTDVLRLDDQLCFALHAASRAMTGAYQPLLEELGVTYPQYLVLMALWEEDGARVSRLGERLYLDSATLTPLLKRLESRALVERRRSRVDERVVEVFLTPEGKRLEQRALELYPQLACKTRLSLGEIVRLRDTLRKLTRTLHEATGEE